MSQRFMLSEDTYVKTIHGGPEEVRAWLNKQEGFINGTYQYLINPIGKDGKEIILPLLRVRNRTLEEYPTKVWRIYRSESDRLKGIPHKKPFLDMGAGCRPHPYATDAVEEGDRKWVTQQVKEDEEEGVINLELFRNKLKKGLNYHFGFNYNKKNLPYPDNYFEVIHSRGSMTYAATPHAFKEVYRTLKPGGKLILVTGDTENHLRKHVEVLKKQGFKKIEFKPISAYKIKNKIHYHGNLIGIK